MRLALPVAIVAALSSPLLAAEGEVRLDSGLVARYAYHFDRNALRDSRRAGDALIALTRSGNLLRFDARTLKLTGEWAGPVAARCLGRGEGDTVLVGFDDGRACRVAPATLALVEVARLSGSVRWIGWSPGGIVAVAEPTIEREWGDGVRRPTRFSVVHDLSSGKIFKITSTYRDPKSGKAIDYDRKASAFFLDSKRRLWLGDDHGEWGGWCYRIDLDEGKVVEVEGIKARPDEGGSGWDGVYGFVELPDGQVWAYGGVMHMGFARGFIRRIDGPKVEALYLYGNVDMRKGHADDEEIPVPDRPYLPISHILPDGDGSLLVFSYSHIYRTDAALRAWGKRHTLKLRYRPGRPDAVGVYPSIAAVHGIDGRLVCATAVDGYVSIAGGEDTSHALPGQFGLERAWRIINSAEGTLFLPWDDGEPIWRLGPGGWEVADLVPPCPPAPDEPQVEGIKPAWDETRILVGPGGTVYTVSATNYSPGLRTAARRVGGKIEILGRETSDLVVRACFITPDGALWNAWLGDLKRLINGRWEGVVGFFLGEKTGKPIALTDEGFQVGWGLEVVGHSGPPWAIVDRDKTQILRLDYGPNFKDAKLDAIRVVEGRVALKIHDAIPRAKGKVVVATDKGLRLVDVASGEAEPSPLPAPDRPITALARDGLGRVWMGGEGLWVVDPNGKRLHDCGAVPMIGRSEVAKLAADPEHRDGVIASLGERGVVFLRVSDRAAR